jgi:hypothetical protein
MAALHGMLYINNTDVYAQYGVFLAEKETGGHENYDALLRPSKSKEQVAINVREQHGEMLPPVLDVHFEARDVTLFFGMEASAMAQFLSRRAAFKEFLRSGQGGYLNVRLTEIDYTFRFYLKEFGAWEQIALGGGVSFARFPVVFREPVPGF